MRFTGVRVTLLVSFALVTVGGSWVQASAQDRPAPSGGFHGFQFDVHGGFLSVGRITAGTSELPAPGPTFMTFQNLPSRYVPSWYFGDGALLANQVTTAMGITNRIAPLDAMLTSASGGRKNGGSFGLRIGHSITRHVLGEFNLDIGEGHLAFGRAALADIEAARASFTTYFDAVLARSANAGNPRTSSTATVVNDMGKQMAMTGDVAINIRSVAGLTPYVTLGGGIVLPQGGAPTATLVGTYDFVLNVPGNPNNGSPFHAADQVLVQLRARPALITVVGTGVQRDLSRHFGFRADIRVLLRATDLVLDVYTAPVNTPANPAARIVRGPGPQLHFSNTDAFPSSLSMPIGFRTFSGIGRQVEMSAAYFVRF